MTDYYGFHFKWNGSYWLIGGGYQRDGDYYNHVYKYDGTNSPSVVYKRYEDYGAICAITDIQWNGSYWLVGVFERSGSYYYSRVYKYTGSGSFTQVISSDRRSSIDSEVIDYYGFRLSAVSLPVGTIAINNNAASTNTTSVTLNITGSGDPYMPTQMMVSQSSSFSGASWESFKKSRSFTLSSGDATTKTIYIKFKNSIGFEGPRFSDTIYLDTRAPSVASTNPTNEASDVSLGSSITVTFKTFEKSYNMQASTNYNSISLKDSDGNAVIISKSISNNILTITPSGANWTVGMTYTVTIPASAVKNNIGPGTNLPAQYTFTFNTGTAYSLDDAVSGQVGIGDIIKLGKYNGIDLTWYYTGNGSFMMTKDSFEAVNIQMRFDDNFNGWSSAELNLWLNNTTNGFIKEAFNNDPMIAYVTIPSVDEYDSLATVCRGEGTYSVGWWLRSTVNTSNYYNGNYTYYVRPDASVTLTTVSTAYRVRPVIRLKAETAGGGINISNLAQKSIFTVAQNKPFAVPLVGEELQGDGITVVKGIEYTVVQAIKGDGYTTLISHPDHNGGTGFSSVGVKVVTVGSRKLYFVVVETPTPTTVGTVNFGE